MLLPGIRGYAERAAELLRSYEEVPFVAKHRAALHLLPTPPVAVEPTAELREPGRALHPSPAIVWLDDRLPGLAAVRALGGALVLSLRHGPVPDGRRMFDVRGDATRSLAERCGVRSVLHAEVESIQAANRAAGVTWTVLGVRSTRAAGAEDPASR